MRIASKIMAGALVALSAAAAGAQPVTYSTLFSCDNITFAATISCPFGTASLSFVGQPVTNVTAPTNIDYGTVQANNPFAFSGQNVYLRVVQTIPTAGTATTVGTVNGTVISNTQSGASIAWNPTTLNIGPVRYTIENATPINAPDAGPNTIRGSVVNTTTPEPATLGLMATGLVGLVGFARRRRAV